MIEMSSTSERDAIKEAIIISKKNVGKYITVSSVFGLFATVSDRLNKFSPSDSVFTWYVLNGKVKFFTDSQKILDQNSTPMMS